MTVQEIKKGIADLNQEEKREVSDFLDDFLNSGQPVEQTWDHEISSRIRDIDEGRVQCIDGDTLMNRFRERYS